MAGPASAQPRSGVVGPFRRREGVLHCGPHSLDDLAGRHVTPLYVYDGDRVLERLAVVRQAFAGAASDRRLLVAYSVKANSNLALLSLLAEAGTGADIVSGGELHAVLRAGIPPERTVFAGVGKTKDEMRFGLESWIRAFHVESAGELDVLAEVAAEVGRPAPVAIRVNPDIDAPTHRFTRTGHARAKFGVSPEEALSLYGRVAGDPCLRSVGIDVHIGSQVRDPAPFLSALDVVLDVARRARRAHGVAIDYVDLGGGYAIRESGLDDLDLTGLGAEVADRLDGSEVDELVVEPGRFLVGDAGILLTRVLYVKRGGGATFVITDAGMTELIRPSHYGGVHEIVAVNQADQGTETDVDVVGPVCEQGDFLARGRRLPLPRPGALLCVMQAGAYGFAMASNYNSRPRPAEVLVRGQRATVVRRREDPSDLLRHQVRP